MFSDNKKNECILSCSCGCDDCFSAHILDGQVYIGTLTSDFYIHQGHFEQLKFALKLLLGKRFLKEVLCTAEDLEAFRDFLLLADYHEDAPKNDETHLIVSWDEDFGYSLCLVSDQPRWKALKFKNHRLFESCLTKDERDMLVRRIDYSLKKHERSYIQLN